MFCCVDSFVDPQKAYNRQTSDGGVSSFPGQRRFQQTGGNALAAAPPPSYGEGEFVSGEYVVCVECAKGQGFTLLLCCSSSFERIMEPRVSFSILSHPLVFIHAVIIPSGVQPGQHIQVQSPQGQTVTAQVPAGMSPGQQFMVQIPPRTVTPPLPPANMVTAQPSAPVLSPHDYSSLTPVTPPQEPFVPPLPGSTTATANPWTTTIPPATTRSAPMVPIMTNAVAVPVQDDNPYYYSSPHPPPPVPIQYGNPPPSIQNGSHPHASPPPQPKLLRVQVPPGTPPGTTLHVSIPDEPGRVVGATVPPNTSEFYISYLPQTTTPMTMNNKNMANGNYYNNNNTAMQQPNGMQNRSNRPTNEGGMGGYVLPLLGGAALGAAGLAMMGHYGQQGEQQQQQQYYDNSSNAQDTGGYDDAGDYGGFGDY
jgi:hypothetical protein